MNLSFNNTNKHKLRLLRQWPILFASLTITIGLSACSSIAPQSIHNLKMKQLHVSGTIIKPTEQPTIEPVSGVTISVANSATDNIPNNSAYPDQTALNKLSCSAPKIKNSQYTCSLADGKFELSITDIKQLPLTLILSKDNVEQKLTLSLNDIGTNLGQLLFDPHAKPINRSKVAVILDFYNPYEDAAKIIEKEFPYAQDVRLELAEQYQQTYNIDQENNDISYPSFFSLFEDKDKNGKADIHNYNTVYINSRSQNDIALLSQDMKETLLQYVSNGGTLFVTEWTFEIETPSLDQYI